MKTIKEIIELVNSYNLPIQIMDNESLSIPFVSEVKGKLYLTFFVYYLQGAYGNAKRKVMVRCVYYINPKDLDDILERKVLNNCEDEPDINLFNRHNIPKDVINNTNKYDFLVDLTDEILTNPENIKEKIILYADYFCACVNNQLKAVYWQYGRTYFEWLNSLL
ncbi:hypothetical protein DXB01_08670 [Clostridium sp. OF10-22XD]|nr:hypothetical protein DXB01_08670 [Clostridium sp. OF10-22XD]